MSNHETGWTTTEKRCLVALVGLIVVAVLAGCGNAEARAQATADSAASIWEAAVAIERGVPAQQVTPAIKAQAAGIIRAQGRTYPPAGVTAP